MRTRIAGTPMTKNKIKIILVLMAVFVFSSACMLTNAAKDAVTQLQQLPTALQTEQAQATQLPSAGSTTIIEPEFANLEGTLEGLYQQVNPGVVSIRVSSVNDEALGSGFVIDKQGHIVTNFHVVENADKV